MDDGSSPSFQLQRSGSEHRQDRHNRNRHPYARECRSKNEIDAVLKAIEKRRADGRNAFRKKYDSCDHDTDNGLRQTGCSDRIIQWVREHL